MLLNPIQIAGRFHKVCSSACIHTFIILFSDLIFRTGKRDLSGMLNDGVNSLAR